MISGTFPFVTTNLRFIPWYILQGGLHYSRSLDPDIEIYIRKHMNVHANKCPMFDDLRNDRRCDEAGMTEKKTGRGYMNGNESENGDGVDAGNVKCEMEAVSWWTLVNHQTTSCSVSIDLQIEKWQRCLPKNTRVKMILERIESNQMKQES
jgi:hypothetical protein